MHASVSALGPTQSAITDLVLLCVLKGQFQAELLSVQGSGEAILIILDRKNYETELEKNMFLNICQGRIDFFSLERKFFIISFS